MKSELLSFSIECMSLVNGEKYDEKTFNDITDRDKQADKNNLYMI